VDGKPFLARAGELTNNSATSLEFMQPVWPKLVDGKLNTVLAGVSWAQIEPEEGKFDFSVPDGVIRDARSHNLHLVFLWFASWKNGLSSYPPTWVKKDFDRFPRAQLVGGDIPWPVLTASSAVSHSKIVGSMSLELLSPFSEANLNADAGAFAALMRHIKEVDGQQHTVIMIQVENEVNVEGDSRDRSPAANKSFAGPVPKELMDYLQKHKDGLISEFRQVWAMAGFKTSGTWEEVFGKVLATDEIFMAWNYSRYIGRVAEAGKAEYPIPMYVNAAVMGFARVGPPERAHSGGPLSQLGDVWRAGGPQIDILSPDIYGNDDFFVSTTASYVRNGNPLFIPESNGGKEGATRALYAFGRHNAMGFSPFGIDGSRAPDTDLIAGYDLISQLAPLISAHQGKDTISAVLLGQNNPSQMVQVGNYTVEAAALRPRAMPGAPPAPATVPSAAAIFIAVGPDEYFVAGSGMTVKFSPNTPGPALAGFGTVEEGSFVNGLWVPGRQLAGDETEQGVSLTFRNQGIQHITLYRYE
jgi:hypothetical protein